jgi:hypothetical protein
VAAALRVPAFSLRPALMGDFFDMQGSSPSDKTGGYRERDGGRQDLATNSIMISWN